MGIRTSDIVAFSVARSSLSDLAKEAKNGHEKVLTLNGASYVALIDADKLDYYHALEEEIGHIDLLATAIEGLEQIKRGDVLDERELNNLLALE
jgi:hypothetical protein